MDEHEEVVITVYGGEFNFSANVLFQAEVSLVRRTKPAKAEWFLKDDQTPEIELNVGKATWVNRVTCTAPRSLWPVVGMMTEKELRVSQIKVVPGDKFTIIMPHPVLALII